MSGHNAMLILLSGIPRKCGHIRKFVIFTLNPYFNIGWLQLGVEASRKFMDSLF
jgi:hypothetical protein